MRIDRDNPVQKAASQQHSKRADPTSKGGTPAKPGPSGLPGVFADAFSAAVKTVEKAAHHQKRLNPVAADLRDALIGTLPTVLDPSQAAQLKSPTVTAHGGNSGVLNITYDLKDPASAAAMAKALNDGINGIEENTAESCNVSDFSNLKITSSGGKVVITADYTKPGGKKLSPAAADLRDALVGTLPTVLDASQTALLASPKFDVSGTPDAGTLSICYKLKDAATANALAAALNSGKDGIEENTAESCNISDFSNLQIVPVGNEVFVLANFTKNP